MERQASFAGSEFAGKKKMTRREKFLSEMEQMVPWARLWSYIILKDRPAGLERMLQLHFLQQCDALAEEALEDALYDSHALRNFARLDLRPRRHSRCDASLEVPPTPGAARTDGATLCRDALVARRAAVAHAQGNHHRRAVLDQECSQRAGYRDAPEQEWL